MPTTVRVTWTVSPEVPGTTYIVHYSIPGGTETLTDMMSSTKRDITGLAIGETYILWVEAPASNRLPSVSIERNITLGKMHFR